MKYFTITIYVLMFTLPLFSQNISSEQDTNVVLFIEKMLIQKEAFKSTSFRYDFQTRSKMYFKNLYKLTSDKKTNLMYSNFTYSTGQNGNMNKDLLNSLDPGVNKKYKYSNKWQNDDMYKNSKAYQFDSFNNPKASNYTQMHNFSK